MRSSIDGTSTGVESATRRGAALLERRFRVLVLMLAGAYFILQLRYIWGLPLVMDEFANGGHIFRVAQGVPYRDYVPYKTVLGYYLLLPGLVSFESSWNGMLAAKAEIAFVTSLVLGGTSLRLRRHFGAPAILGGLLLLFTQSTFLERASELRVDTLSALFGLVSLLAFLEKRAILSGVMVAGALLMTQKGAYFAVSLGCASAWSALRTRQFAVVAEAALTAISALAAFAAYVVFWCVIGDAELVWRSLFEGPRRIAFAQLYHIDHFWTQTLERNPIYYAIAAAGMLLLVPRRKVPANAVAERLWSYAIVHLALCAWHKQPWPYFFVMLIPTAWVLCIAALDRQVGRGSIWVLATGGLVAVGSLVSAVQRIPIVLERSSVDQRRVVEAADAFLTTGGTYLAGTELLWRRPHMARLAWLDKPRVEDIRRTPDEALDELRAHPPRLIIDNYRIQVLPPVLREELDRSFIAVGGNLRTYAPKLAEGAAEARYEYGGLYKVVASPGGRVSVDGGDWLEPDAQVYLSAGLHQLRTTGGARLAAWSEAPVFIDQVLRPPANLFPNVYTY